MKKYAVFQTKNGQYYYRYADTLEALEGSGFEKIITEEQLPVVLDNKGGYFKFNPSDANFVEVIETASENPLPLERMFYRNSPDFKLGWISPDGDSYSCSFTNHSKCAEMLAQKYYPNERFPETALLRKGWIKVIDSWNGRDRQHGQFVYSETGYITQKAADKLYDLGLYDKPEVRKLRESSENSW